MGARCVSRSQNQTKRLATVDIKFLGWNGAGERTKRPMCWKVCTVEIYSVAEPTFQFQEKLNSEPSKEGQGIYQTDTPGTLGMTFDNSMGKVEAESHYAILVHPHLLFKTNDKVVVAAESQRKT